jgi:hypothetical protein
MKIETAQPRRIERLLRQDLAIGDDAAASRSRLSNWAITSGSRKLSGVWTVRPNSSAS